MISYQEYIMEKLNKTLGYSEYISQEIDNNISYSEYLSGAATRSFNLDKRRESRRNRIKNLFNE